ncbi:hypothetical protein [Phytohabitans suffuscus]|uniref:hypothetical protein n=1 Tax=Phytohabitans suffuscus TaxID=624315 RepID=UPI001565782F|nr:hypothetical protein [Phytohabitans suffuscus]
MLCRVGPDTTATLTDDVLFPGGVSSSSTSAVNSLATASATARDRSPSRSVTVERSSTVPGTALALTRACTSAEVSPWSPRPATARASRSLVSRSV